MNANFVADASEYSGSVADRIDSLAARVVDSNDSHYSEDSQALSVVTGQLVVAAISAGCGDPLLPPTGDWQQGVDVPHPWGGGMPFSADVQIASSTGSLKDTWNCPTPSDQVFSSGFGIDESLIISFLPPTLTCTSPVVRGQITTCQLIGGPAGSTYSWKFADSNNNTATASGTSAIWSGMMVTSGVVSVSVNTPSETLLPSPVPVVVTNRPNFAFTAVDPSRIEGNVITCYEADENGVDTYYLESPPAPSSREGQSCADMAYSFDFTEIVDGGPNNGFGYVTRVSPISPDSQPTKYEFTVVSDLLDSGSTFYASQCGDFSGSNQSGFIAGSQLTQNVFDHEQGSVYSHWTEYRDAQNDPNNNIGTVLEAVIGTPGMADYKKVLNDAVTAAKSRIASAVKNEPCQGSNTLGTVVFDSSQSCKFCGTVNYSPYQSCQNSSPVPYCQ